MVVHATSEAERLRSQVTKTDQRLAEARNAEAGDRRQHDRQLRVDLVRALAVLAAQVKQSDRGPRRRRARCARSTTPAAARSCSPVASLATRSSTTRADHDALDPDLRAGSAATVVRGGFTWADDGKPVTLVKAQVVPA